MDGVVYSTSQFGLDERFGDGDTSQINLDLDEELFLDEKNATFGHGGVSGDDLEASTEPMTPWEKDEIDEGITENSDAMLVDSSGNQPGQPGDLSVHAEFNEYAQAPSTPGLVEEPNLSSVQEALGCDDHLESEDHNATELIAAENTESAFSKSHFHHVNQNGVDRSFCNDSNHVAVECMLPEENGYHSRDLEIKQTELQGDLLAELVKPIPSVTESSYGTVGALDCLNREENIQNGVVSNNESSVPSLDVSNREDSVTVRLDEGVASPSCAHVISALDVPGQRTWPTSTCLHVTEAYVEDDPVSLQPKIDSDFFEVSDNVEKSFSHDKAGVSGRAADVDLEMLNHPAVQEETPSVHSHVLRHCSSHLSQYDTSSFGGESCQVTDVIQSKENQMSEPALCGETHEDSRKPDDQEDNMISIDNQWEYLNNFATSELPAPERLLSVQEGLLDKPDDLLVAPTPEKETLEEGDGISSGSKLISGKKRSFTESTITIESINTIETFGVARSKRTAESIPDDDDLLSSILVGRRSTVLKMKPTPPVPEVTSKKRTRTTPRPSATKRKVLLDDTMVLHGKYVPILFICLFFSTIRQQLTNTEDIRRIRKKAPCTRPEISMIQRHFLEDEIFSETLLTGLSGELVWLHCKTYELSGIRVFDDVNNISEVAKEAECSGSAEFVLRNDVRVPTAENFTHSDSRQGEDPHLGFQGFDSHGHTDSISDVPGLRTSQLEPLVVVTELEIDKESTGVADAANYSVVHGFEMSSATDPVLRDICIVPAGEKADGADTSLQIDAACLSIDQKIDTQPVEEYAPLLDISSGKVVDAIQVAGHNVDNLVVVENESGARDKIFIECQVGASMDVRADFQTDCSAPIDDTSTSIAAVSPETVGGTNVDSVNGGQATVEIENKEEQVVVVAADLSFNNDPTSNCIFSDELKIDSAYSAEFDVDASNTSLLQVENSACEQADPQSDCNAAVTSFDPPSVEDHDEIEHISVDNDTDFLNVDDDELVEDGDDGMPCDEGNRLLDNSGWSSRTRAVAKYLQILFGKEAVHGRRVLPMDNLLAGKTRKEASRMFFETLVLKTKDYIHVEQAKPFENISVTPRGTLMKSNF
ncbi:Rad21_Rec8 domain-containing protein [Cephalotus follicularis]|uniref:Rad21_Rec8 domain-containing protein n=1 Tax=Cephalotus follicularis TaxID=3775 RepID=A0A1Q3CUU1_CEPFO|nr:Rad21_Rec8 domain-containing protein [Cephalotus follicularis]